MQEVNGNEDKNAQLKDIVEQVNKVSSLPNLTGGELVPFSDIEGQPRLLLKKLKRAGVIKSVKNEDGRIKIELNPKFHGTIDFCGDLTAFKHSGIDMCFEEPYGNEIVIEVFEELLTQIKEHNKDKDKDQQIQFVAVPGNHEFIDGCGSDDYDFLLYEAPIKKFNKYTPEKTLLAKIKGLKVIAEIQKYFLQQVKQNGDDINDYDYNHDYNEVAHIEQNIKNLNADIKSLERMISNISEYSGYVKDYHDCPQWLQSIVGHEQWMLDEMKRRNKQVGNTKDENIKNIQHWLDDATNKLSPLLWQKSNVLLKTVFCHQKKRFRTLHSFSLFTPSEYLKSTNDNTFNDQQQEIYSHSFKERLINDEGLGKKGKLPNKKCFNQNFTPSIVGHENGISMEEQTDKVFCVDAAIRVFVVDDKNVLKVHWIEKNEIDATQQLAIHSIEDNKKIPEVEHELYEQQLLQAKEHNVENELLSEKVDFNTANMNSQNIITISNPPIINNDIINKIGIIDDYVNASADTSEPQDIVNTIRTVIKEGQEKLLEKYSRIFAFSQKDKRAQQVYQTYKMLTESQNEINTSNPPKPNQTMIELNSIHSINTPCGCGCL